MSALWKELMVVAAGLLVAAAAVYGLGDRAVLVSPPEMVAEGFVHALALRRWGPAREHLASGAAERVDADSLRAYLWVLEHRIGAIEEARGESFFATVETAEAEVRMATPGGGSATLRLPLLRENGLWKVSRVDLDGLTLSDTRYGP